MTNPKKTHAGSGNAPVPPPIPCKRRLNTAQDVRTFLADLVNRANRGEVDTATAKCIGYLLQILNGVISTSDLEQRLAALEDAKEQRR